MIIKYNNNESLKNTLEELVTLHVNFHEDLSEKELYDILIKECDIGYGRHLELNIEPEVNVYKPRPNFGWKHSTLRYLANADDFSLFLPESELLPTKTNVEDIQKYDPKEDLIPIDKAELLRDLKALDIQLSKLIKKIEGGTW